MWVTTGRAVNRKSRFPDEDLAEGMVVTILAPDDCGTFTLGPEAEATLLASIEEADRGEVVSAPEGVAARLSLQLPLQVTHRAWIISIRKATRREEKSYLSSISH